MKFIIGIVTGWLLCIAILLGLFFYFDLDEYTLQKDDTEETQQLDEQYNTKEETSNNDDQTFNPPLEEQQQNYDDNIKSMTDEEYAEWEKENYPPQEHNEAGTNNYEYAKENGLIDEDK